MRNNNNNKDHLHPLDPVVAVAVAVGKKFATKLDYKKIVCNCGPACTQTSLDYRDATLLSTQPCLIVIHVKPMQHMSLLATTNSTEYNTFCRLQN